MSQIKNPIAIVIIVIIITIILREMFKFAINQTFKTKR